jgi:hypothetical protein
MRCAERAHAQKGFQTRCMSNMKTIENAVRESGKAGYALLWLLGVPLPILLIIYLIRGH